MKVSINKAVKFGILTAILSMFIDAGVGHGLFWQNDPFWSYWITDTMLITTIVTIGTTIIGIGLWQGALLMFIQVLTLEIYYQFLSPVGLPQVPYWLNHFEVWIEGIPIHFLVYLSGYLIALWIWFRKEKTKKENKNIIPWKISLYSITTATLIVIFDLFFTQLFLLKGYPGFTFLLQRFIISTVFLLVWNSHIGVDDEGVISGTILLTLQWLTYTLYLGPLGLPKKFPYFLTYNQLWTLLFPGTLLSVFVVLLIMKRFKPKEEMVK